jgi:hypothetical protein
LDQFPKYNVTILLGRIQCKSSERRYFHIKMGNENLREISIATSESLINKSKTFSHRNILMKTGGGGGLAGMYMSQDWDQC